MQPDSNRAGPQRGKARPEPIAVALRFIHASTNFSKGVEVGGPTRVRVGGGDKKQHGECRCVYILSESELVENEMVRATGLEPEQGCPH